MRPDRRFLEKKSHFPILYAHPPAADSANFFRHVPPSSRFADEIFEHVPPHILNDASLTVQFDNIR